MLVPNIWRQHDSGSAAGRLNSGEERVLVAPGVDQRLTPKVRLYDDAAIPIYRFTNAVPSMSIEGTTGQLVASALLTVRLAYDVWIAT